MKNIVIFILTSLLLCSNIFAQDQNGFLETIMLEKIDRLYNNDSIIADSSYTISMNFDLNRYRLNEPITMEIKIFAKKGTISFTNSINPFNNYIFEVYDNYNNKVLPSDNYSLWKYKNEDAVSDEKDRVVTLNEGESYSYYIDLNNWFTFNKKGKYRIEGRFNPMPEISDKFSMKADTTYFFVDEAINNRNNNSIMPNSINNSIIPNNLPVLYPDAIVSNTLFAMQTKDWDKYFQYMHMPSIISISQRYAEIYRTDYSNTYIEDFTDLGVIRKVRELNFTNFLKKEFNNSINRAYISTNFGNNFYNNLELAYKSKNIKELAIKFDILYRTSLPEDRQALFEEYKKYLASAYDRRLRNNFTAELQRNIVSARDPKLKAHYTTILNMIKEEYNPAISYSLLNFTIEKTTITEEYGLPRAMVETKLFNRFFNADDGNIYNPIIRRIFILRKLGEYWYIVNYYDAVVN